MVSPHARAQRNRRIVEKANKGWTYKQIAEHFGIGTNTVRWVLVNKGWKHPDPYRQKSERNQKIVAAWSRGLRPVDIAKRFNVSKNWVYKLIRRHWETRYKDVQERNKSLFP